MMVDVTPPRQMLPSPPPDFPVYGLDASYPGARWLESFGDATGDEVRWVRLAHQSLDAGSMIMVETHSRALTDAQARQHRESPLRLVAFDAAVVMVNLTLPAESAPRPEGLLPALVDHADERSMWYAEWSPVAWQVNNIMVTARVWWFAGGWAAFSDTVPGVYLGVAGGEGSDPGGLAFAALPDGSAYHFDLDQPLHPKTIAASSSARTGGERPPLQRQDWHDDQLRLIRGQGQ
jgi:hypothetical protein